jgi:hypothetical protein
MGKKFKIILGILVIIAVAGFAGYKYMMTGGARHVENEDAAYTLTAEQLAKEFSENEPAASAKYLNKAIAVSGTVTATDKGTATLNGQIICTLHDTTNVAGEDAKIVLKGRVVGYDDLMQEVRLDECSITETK